jgi:hypothetical protein
MDVDSSNARTLGESKESGDVESKYAEVINAPTPKEKKELKQCLTLLQQYCSQTSATLSVSVENTNEKNKWGVPVHLAIARLCGAQTHEHSVPATSPKVAKELAQRGVLFAAFPQCKTVQDVQKKLKEVQKVNKKESKARAKQKREDFIMSLFPDCTTIEEARARIRSGWATKSERRKRSHSECLEDPHDKDDEMEPMDDMEMNPRKKRRKLEG